MKDEIQKRIDGINAAETTEELKKFVCPFFKDGGHTDCVTCKMIDDDVEACRDYYLERIATHPMDVWSEDFDRVIVFNRDKVSVAEVVGIGTNCDSCYMSDKCPLYKQGFACGIDWGGNKPTTPDEFVEWMLSTQYERVKRASVFEQVDGGVPDANLSAEIDRLTGLVNMKVSMGRDHLHISLDASSGGRSEGGILAKLFGGGSKPAVESAKEPKAIEATDTSYEEVKTEKKPIAIER